MALLKAQFKGVKREERLLFLQSRIRNTLKERVLRDREYRKRAKPMGMRLHPNTPCYICDGVATLRHHVIPVSHGGSNRFNNLVPLCHSCHTKVHAPFRLKEPEYELKQSEREKVAKWFEKHLDRQKQR